MLYFVTLAEEEKKMGEESPQFDLKDIDSQFSKVTDVPDTSCPLFGDVSVVSTATTCGPHSLIQNSSQIKYHEDNMTVPSSSSQTTSTKADSEVIFANKVLMTDVQCAVCKQLLCRPVVLNCGHGKLFLNFLNAYKIVFLILGLYLGGFHRGTK